jgi:hypothetical protein
VSLGAGMILEYSCTQGHTKFNLKIKKKFKKMLRALTVF